MRITCCLLLTFLVAESVRADGVLELIPQTTGPYGPGQVVNVDVWLQSDESQDQTIRYVLLDAHGRRERLMAGGQFTASGQHEARAVARLSGDEWEPVVDLYSGSGISGNVSVLASCFQGSAAGMFVGGHEDIQGYQFPFVRRWNGTTWFELPGPISGYYVESLLCHGEGSQERLMVGGLMAYIGDTKVWNLVRWTGHDWEDTVGVDGRVEALTRFDDGGGEALFAGGDFTAGFPFSPPLPLYYVARFDGQVWQPLDRGVLFGYERVGIRAMAVFDGGQGEELYIGGDFRVAVTDANTTIVVNNLARWDGNEWASVGGGTTPGTAAPVKAMTVFDDGTGPALFVGGSFASVGGTAANNIARWNGSTWASLGTGVTGGSPTSIRALYVFDDGSGPALYVAGNFTNAGGVSVNNIARWNGSTWTGVGDGFDGEVASLTAYSDVGTPNLGFSGDFEFDYSGLVDGGATYLTTSTYPWPRNIYLGLAPAPGTMLTVPAGGAVRLGTATVQLPETLGTYTLSVMRELVEIGLGFGVDPGQVDMLWTMIDGNLTGGTLDLEVVPEPPTLTSIGCRYLGVSPTGSEAVRMLVKPNCPSGQAKYVGAPFTIAPHGRFALLVDDPAAAALLTPAEWGAPVKITGASITPNTNYIVQLELAHGVRSVAATVATRKWGDANGDGTVNFTDISRVVEAFQGNFTLATFAGCDIEPPSAVGACAAANRLINFLDVNAAQSAFQGANYPCPACPG